MSWSLQGTGNEFVAIFWVYYRLMPFPTRAGMYVGQVWTTLVPYISPYLQQQPLFTRVILHVLLDLQSFIATIITLIHCNDPLHNYDSTILVHGSCNSINLLIFSNKQKTLLSK